MTEHFADLTPREKTIKRDEHDTKTLQEQLVDLKRHKKLVGGRLSPKLRDSLKGSYCSSSSAAGGMRINKTQSVRTSLREAMAILLHENPTKRTTTHCRPRPEPHLQCPVSCKVC